MFRQPPNCTPFPTRRSSDLLTLSSSSCTIASGASTCNVSMTWSTTNPVLTSNITSEWPSIGTVVQSGNSGTSVSAPVAHEGTHLYSSHDGVLPAHQSATASC